MTDEQIIKALEHCSGSIQYCCQDCPFYEQCENDDELVKYALDLVNRQKETIQNQDEMIRALINAQETLQKETERLNFENLQMVASIKNLKSEAIKEFAEGLKYKIAKTPFVEDITLTSCIDDFVKEMGVYDPYTDTFLEEKEGDIK